MKRLLVTGASGFLGWNLCKRAYSRYGSSVELIGLAFHHQIDIPHVKVHQIDLCNPGKLDALLARLNPDVIIHTAAISQPNECQQNAKECARINIEVPAFLARWCASRSVSFVFTSSDLIFDGKRAPYDESAAVSPVNIYGQQKAEAERIILETHPRSAVCRMPLMFGDPGPSSQSFIQPMLRSLHEKKQIRLFTDEFRTPVDGSSAADGLLMAAEKVSGTIHLGGRERISRYNFGLLLAELLGCSESLIVPVLQKDVQQSAPRPQDVSLDSSRAYHLGYAPRGIRDSLRDLVKTLSK
jgi:dTDP-4-dehydrorhamnose reductase